MVIPCRITFQHPLSQLTFDSQNCGIWYQRIEVERAVPASDSRVKPTPTPKSSKKRNFDAVLDAEDEPAQFRQVRLNCWKSSGKAISTYRIVCPYCPLEFTIEENSKNLDSLRHVVTHLTDSGARAETDGRTSNLRTPAQVKWSRQVQQILPTSQVEEGLLEIVKEHSDFVGSETDKSTEDSKADQVSVDEGMAMDEDLADLFSTAGVRDVNSLSLRQKRHIAEGAIAGIEAAERLRSLGSLPQNPLQDQSDHEYSDDHHDNNKNSAESGSGQEEDLDCASSEDESVSSNEERRRDRKEKFTRWCKQLEEWSADTPVPSNSSPLEEKQKENHL